MERIFDHRFVSFISGFMKPDREAYAHALKSLGVEPGAVYFFDDLPANVAAARDVGINAFLVRGVAETEARLRAEGHPPVDVIVITAAKDADSVRAAMQRGALHYLLKPFNFPALRDKLLSYAQMRTRLSAVREADQRTVDRVFGALRAPDQLAGAKGRSVHTLEAVEQLLMETADDLSAAEVAERTGMSRATAQRYLSHLHEVGRVDIRLRYGSGGRPEHGYRWHGPA